MTKEELTENIVAKQCDEMSEESLDKKITNGKIIKDSKILSRMNWILHEDVKEFIKRRLERIDLIIKLYPHKAGEELAGQLKEDLMNDAGKELI